MWQDLLLPGPGPGPGPSPVPVPVLVPVPVPVPVIFNVFFLFFYFIFFSRNLSKIVSVLLSASVERFDVSRMRDFIHSPLI